MNKFKFIWLLVCMAILMVVMGCATIPSEAPELSNELGKRISAIETANLNLLHKYFDFKRDQIDKFVEEEWVPLFAKNFFENPTISKAWDTVVRENDANERLKFIIKLGPRLQTKINNKRIELIKPLDDLERSIEQKIRDEYNQARAINNTLTSFLLSASKVAENRNRYLEKVGIKEEEINNYIDKTDRIISDVLGQAKEVQGLSEKVSIADYNSIIKEYKNKINDIIENL